VVLSFAIFYRLQLPHLPAPDALFKTLLVFGTIGYPLGAEVIVALQIAIDFLLLAVFLAVFVGGLGIRDRSRE
jgi:predicted branched-subunit amino acid permease